MHKRASRLLLFKYKWILIVGILLLCLAVILSIIILSTLGSDDSKIEQVLLVDTAPSDIIIDALRYERKFGGEWLEYMTASYVLAEFKWQDVDIGEVVKLRCEENMSYKEILGNKYKDYKGLKKYYEKTYDDIAHIDTDEDGNEIIQYDMFYPIPKGYDYNHLDDFGAGRTYGGDRNHMGNDIMADKGTPIIAIASGRVEKIGWNKLGGWRIGIRDGNNRYWYYAHMDRYVAGIDENDRINEGEIIGYVGNSGYGPVGTTGKFEEHLHVQIGVEFEKGKLSWINPHGIIEAISSNKVDLEKNK